MVTPTKVAIAADSPETIKAGAMIARRGGNVVDIAVACALAAAHSEILMCSLGGSAFLNIKLPGKDAELFDGADAMPTSASGLRPEEALWRKAEIQYGDGICINVGHGSVAVPGMLSALELAWKRYGKLEWKEIMEPAILFAKEGAAANQTLGAWLDLAGEAIFWPQKESRKCFFPNGKKIEFEQKFTIPDYVPTLELISKEGVKAFYEGDLSILFEKEMKENGGYVTRKDLADYKATIRKPLLMNSGEFSIALNPPPAVGGAMVGSMIRLYESQLTPDMSEAQKVLLKAKAQRLMFSLRHEQSEGDWCEEKAKIILEEDWLKKYQDKVYSPHTMHMSFATEDGAVVSVTMSNGYGSGITIPGTGITCNNSLGEPELNPHGFFQIPPEGKFVSNMSPTIAWNDKGETIAMGSPGASRITTSIFQGWVNYALEGMDVRESTLSPRFHVENLDGVFTMQHEPGVDTSLAKEIFKLRSFESRDMYFGALNIAGRGENGKLFVSADDRRHGAELLS